MARCKSCGAEIIWAKTPAGKMMPYDAVPAPNSDGVMSHVSHFATCPDGDNAITIADGERALHMQHAIGEAMLGLGINALRLKDDVDG